MSEKKHSERLEAFKAEILEDQGYDDAEPICVQFPLEGQWRAVNSPGDKIPSHGTNQLGQRFAYDFLHEEDFKLAKKLSTNLIWTFFGLPLAKTHGWKQRILSPVSGKVVEVRDGWKERKRLSVFDFIRALTAGFRFSEEKLREDLRPLAGNYIVIEADEVFVFVAHLTTNSTRVSVGELVSENQHIGDVGHTGNSTAPHLHIHLMDNPDPISAKGLPMSFKRYERLGENGEWADIESGIPSSEDVLRSKV